ncbi:MAG: OmpA family protein [Rhodospirillales bacterium]|nr:MAG: OmpA family protein [Rhodospirillales bacterium]
MKRMLMTGAALGALLAGGAQAQVQQPGFFGSIDGLMALKTQSGGTSFFDVTNATQKAQPGVGLGAQGQIGYRFDATAWDVAIGGRFMDYRRGDSRGGGATVTTVTDAQVWNIDGSVGYTISGPGYGVRPFVGVRYQRSTADLTHTVGTPLASETKSWGIGPRVGVDGALRLTESVSLIGGVETSFLFGKIKSNPDAALVGVGGNSGNTGRLIWDIAARAGLDWEIAPLVHLAAGYQVEWIDGNMFSVLIRDVGGAGSPRGRSGTLNHGPFVRLAYNWGAPPSGPAPVQPPKVAGKKSYIVFFDFDRALITPTAATTIKQAAADAKAGKSTRLDVTGHADKSGGDAYNMALSLRRGNAVKDQLVREGIPANQIAVVGRGESMPLVQTADGVREPQNRRVEIVLN